MGEKEIGIFIASTTAVFVIFFVTFFYIVTIYRKRKNEHVREVKQMTELHQKEILKSQLESQWQTMQNIGADLHDNIGQKLTLATLYLNRIDLGNVHSEELRERLQDISTILNDSLADIRSLSRELAPADTRDYLHYSYQKEIERINKLKICKATFSLEGSPYAINSQIKIILERVVQEFIQNSLKHARCKNIRLKLEYLPERVHIFVSDDGIGFNFQQVSTQGGNGIGLQNIRKRIELLKGQLTFDSKKGSGTTLQIEVPVTENAL